MQQCPQPGPAWATTASSTDERHEPHEADNVGLGEGQRVVQVVHLAVADEDEESVVRKRVDGDRGLLLPVELARAGQRVAVERGFGIDRPHKTVEPRRRLRVVPNNLLPNPEPDELTK